MNYFLNNFRRHGTELNSHDLLKFLAISLMVVDHVGLFFFHDNSYFRLVGRLSFPIFFFLIGYSLNYKIHWDLAVMAVLLAANNLLIHWPFLPLNILFSVIFCRIFLQWAERKGYLERHLPDVLVVLIFFILSTEVLFEYGAISILFALLGFLTRKREQNKPPVYPYIITAAAYCLFQIIGFSFNSLQSSALIPAIFLLCWFFKDYRFHKLTGVPAAISYPVMFIGRNSLVIYFLHIAAFKWIYFLNTTSQVANH